MPIRSQTSSPICRHSSPNLQAADHRGRSGHDLPSMDFDLDQHSGLRSTVMQKGPSGGMKLKGRDQLMTQSSTERGFTLTFRLLMARTFLYAATHQVFNPKFSAVAFLNQTTT